MPYDVGQTIDGSDNTLLPGLIDGHTHAVTRESLERALVFGVTTQLDMFTDESFAAQMRQEQVDGEADDRADLFSAGTLATAPRGHPTQLGMDIPTLNRPEDAEPWIADRAAAGADYIKVVIEEGFPEIGPMPTLDAPTVEALVTAAHARDLLVVTHVHSAAAARTAIDAGTDGLAHMFNDVLPDDELIDLAVGADVCVIATLPVMEHIGDDARPDRTIADDSELRPFLTDQDRRSLADPYTGFDSVGIDQAQGGIRLLAAAGVAIIAGSDAPNPGTAYGASLHREVELLSESGLSATDALAAATSVPAERFGLDDRGRIAEGRRADLVLVDGDPTTDILATRAIVGVWKAGVAMDRDAFRTDR